MIRFSLVIIFVLLVTQVSAQEITKFYTWDWKQTTIAYARFYAVIVKEDSLWHRRDFYIQEKKLQMDGYYRDSSCTIAEGPFAFFHSNGKLESAGRYANGQKTGTWLSFHSNGMMRDSAHYTDGETVGTYLGWHSNGYVSDSGNLAPDGSGMAIQWFDNGVPAAAGKFAPGKKKHGTWQYFHRNGQLSCKEVFNNGLRRSTACFTESGAPDDTLHMEREASFPGGNEGWKKFLMKHMYFPDDYKIVNSDKAVVVVSATVDEEGNLVDAHVSTSFHPVFDKIALNIIRKSPKWQPAMTYNRRVKYFVRQAIYFAQAAEE